MKSYLKVNINAVLDQVKIDRANHLFIWKPSKLKDNIFELIAILGKLESVAKMDKSPYQLNRTTWAWRYFTKEEVTVMEIANCLSKT
jgi:hypothetical protein